MQNYGKLYRFLMIAMMMLTSGMAWAWVPPSGGGTFYLRTNTTDATKFDVTGTKADGTSYSEEEQTELNGFTITGGTYTLVFENTSTIIMNGQIFINAAATDNAHLIMELGTAPSGSNLANPTMKIIGMTRQQGSGQDVVFFLANIADSSTTDHTITIQGNDDSGSPTFDHSNPQNFDPTNLRFNNNFVIDGDGPVLTAVGAQPMSPQVQAGTDGSVKNYGMFRIQQGGLHLKNVTVQNFSTTWANGGTVQVFTNNQTAGIDLEFDHCLFTSIGATNASVLRMQGNGGTNEYRNASIKYCRFENTFGSQIIVGATTSISTANATIRTFGNNKTPLTIKYSHINQNYGCPVRWHGCGSSTPMDVQYCLIENNFTMVDSNVVGGGGLLLKGPASIQNCIIRYNRTNGNGGGIYLSTYTDFNSGTPDLIPEHSILRLDPNTLIHNNIAQQNGGGVAIEAKRMFNNYYYYGSTYLSNTYGYIYWTANPDGTPKEPFRVEFQQNGGKVYDNTANNGYGGGVFINRESQCTYYGVVCKLDYGEITGNTAANGGGVAIVTTDNEHVDNPNNIPTNVYPQDVIVEVSGASLNQQMLIQGNTANANGGGIYLEAYPIEYNGVTSTVTTTVLDYSNIQNNTASTSGGGLYVERGTVSILKNNDNGTHKPTISKNTATNGNGGGVYLNNGVVRIKGAVIGGANSTDGNTAQNGGGIYVATGSILIDPEEDETTATHIGYNTAALNGGGICNNQGIVEVFGNRSTDAKVQITYNKASTGSGGGIFCMGVGNSNDINVRLRRVNLSNNEATNGGGNVGTGVTAGSGGGLYLQQGLIGISYTDIGSNTAKLNGGGINNHDGSIFLMESTVSGNSTTSGSGGGIYTYSGNILVNQQQDGTSFEETTATQITNNTAYLNGGGLNTHNGYIKMHSTNATTRIQVTGNKASYGSGGGIFCMGSGSSTTEYINVMHADITGNEATNGGGSAGTNVTAGCGGGIYLQEGIINITDVNLQSNTAKVNGGGINNHSGSINVRGCRIGGSSSTGNSAEGNGGGIYTRLGNIDINDYTVTEGGFTRYQSKVTYNTAGGNGGGLDTHSGTVTVNGDQDDDAIEITHNTASYGGGIYAYQGTIVAYNALINNNTATSGNGGGINNHSGDITVYGGQLSNNTATNGNGGGAYTNVGDIDILYFPFSDTYADTLYGTVIYNNLARYNGGGLNNHTGRIDVRYATLRNNTATLGNGGGIYCNGPHARTTGKTIRLMRTIIDQNKTRGQNGTESDPTGRGGGIYLKYGSIFAQGSLIRNNIANINGGGLNNHDGDIRVFGCIISGNTATYGKGGGIYTQTGDITTGPCYLYRASQIINNTAYINGGGINNHEGNIFLNGDLISGNTATTGNGGGIYIANGTIDMYGGRITDNTANASKGGGVYSGGGTFNIQERQKLPVVEVIDAYPGPTSNSAPSDTIHYHLMFAEDANTSHEHGFKYAVRGSTTPTTVQVSTTYLTPGCYKHHLTGLTEATTYWVVAYATNDNGTNVSDTTWFTTLSATLPTVFTGSYANATSASVEINGKILDTGGSDITQLGIQYSTDQSTWTSVAYSDATAIFFTITATGLSANTTYYYRAYATNTSGTAYGETSSFTTAKQTPNINGNVVSVSAIGSNTATFSFTIPAQSGVQCCGFVWSTDDDPELTEDYSIQCTVPSGLESSAGTITATPTNLDPATIYYVRAYVSFEAYDHGANPANYTMSTPTQFITTNTGGLPTVRSIELADITQYSLIATGQVIDNGGNAITARGYCYSTNGTTDPSTWTTAAYSGTANETEEYEVSLSSLTAGTTYYLCAYATNSAGTVYGNHFNVTTLPVTIPEVVISSIATEIPSGETTANATITCIVDDGGGTISAYGITYSTHSDMSSSSTVNGSNLSNGTFSITLTGLVKNTTYYLQAFATNAIGTHTTQKVSFTTPYDPFTITLNSITAIGSNTATANATVTPASDNIKTYGLCWSTYSPAKRSTSTPLDQNYYDVYYNATGVNTATNYNHTFAPTYPNTRYYVKAYASLENSGSNTGGSLNTLDYSSEVNFLTLPAMTTGASSNITKSTATLSGTIATADPHHYLTECGICWSTSTNPTITDSHLFETIGTANSSTHSFSMNATGLSPSTTYYYRAYCKNSENNYAYSEDQSFTTPAYNLTVEVSPTAGGTVSPTLVGMNSGDTQSVTATPNAGYSFSSWTTTSGTLSGSSDNPVTFTMGSNDATLTATFTANTYTLTLEADPSAGGSVSGSGNVTFGSTVTITATPNSNYQFVNWTVDGEEVSDEATYTFTYDYTSNVTITAHFTSRGRGTSATLRPRDIYPAPAREPWNWDDDFFVTDTIVRRNEQPVRGTVEPTNTPQVDNNSAVNGGGIYINSANATLVFSDGNIHANYASENGGGVFIGGEATMQMKGTCQVTDNHVPATGKGGGIYLDGILNVGNLPTDAANAHTLTVTGNWTGGDTYSDATRNNVFLPTDAVINSTNNTTRRVITLLSDISGKNASDQFYTNIGISVEHGFREVIFSPNDYTSTNPTRKWLIKLMPSGSGGTLNSALFDDSRKYYALHVHPSDGVFDDDYIYFWSCWTSIVTTDPNNSASPFYVGSNTHYEVTDNVWHIKTNYGLAWFSSIINGLNNQTAQPTVSAVIENDLDMSAYFWVPLGSVTGVSGTGQSISFTDGGSYQGTFDGQGHIIKGLICTYMTGIFKYGLFGTVGDNGVVKNTFVDDYRFTTYKQKRETSTPGEYEDYNPTYYMGGIAAQVTGTGIIKNCEARGEMKTPMCDADNTCVGGLVGLINSTTGTEVHSSMAMPEIVGTTIGSTVNPFTAKNVGGLVGKINANNMLKNSFANVKLGTIANTVNVGGLVGNNLGTVENCYARLQNTYTTRNPAPSNFYWFAGANTGTITYCYAPERSDCTSIAYVPTGTTANPTGHGKYTATVRVSGKYGFKHRDHQLTAASSSKDAPTTYISTENNNTLSGGLMTSLNAWVADNTGYSVWTRTMASPINDDYPILEFADFNAVGSEDSIYMLYNADVNPMITAFNAVDATKHPTPSIYLYDVNPTTLNVSNDDNVMLAINEDVGILQSVPLKARVGVTIKNTRKGANDYTDDPNWHLFSSAINNVPMGLDYHTENDQHYKNYIVNGGPHADDVWGDRDQFDPPMTTWSTTPGHIGYFPTNTPYGTWRPGTTDGQSASNPAVGGFFDLFDYSEVYYHWMNYKREGTDAIQDHWHYDKDAQDKNHYKISGYRNDVTMPAGKGYLMALSGESMMMADGTLNTGEITKSVTKTPTGDNLPPHGHGSYAYDEPYRSLNIAGNPYQSYLDFHEFVSNTEANNSDLLFSENGENGTTYYSYATRSADGKTYQYFTTTQSTNPATAGPYLHPHQGFFVKVTDNGELKFNNAMRATSAEDSHFRYEQIDYPLVNLFCYDANGKRDYTTVEISRPEAGGGHKMENLCMSDAQIYARYNDDNYQILFAPEGVNVVPVRCKVIEDGYFTMRWSTYHGDFSYLHLIDNLTGADVDCLTTDEYKFEGKASDYNSRFKLVFDCTGIDEPEAPEPDEGPTVFAFQMGDELIVNGEGVLQMFDLNGRCLMTRQAVGQQSSVSLPQVAAGMYLLRLTSNKQVRVQKMVIK